MKKILAALLIALPSLAETKARNAVIQGAPVNVCDKMAVCPSGGDDTAAIQLAVNAVTAPGTMMFSGGRTYKINGTVNVPLGVSIDGNGAVLDVTGNTGVVFDYNAGGGVLSFNQPTTVFQRFRVNGTAANTATRLVQTFRVPYFVMRDVNAYFVNVAKINGGNIITKFDHVINYEPVGTSFWFTVGSDSFGPNFTEFDHVWCEFAQNSGVVCVRIDSGDIRIHHSYFENVPLMIWLNGGSLSLDHNSFNFRGFPAQGLLISSAAGVAFPEVIIDTNDWNMGESSSGANTQVLVETTGVVSLNMSGNKIENFNSVSTPVTVLKATAPSGQMFGKFNNNRVYAQGQAGYQELISVFDPTTVTNAFEMNVNSNFFFGSAAATNGQVDFTKAGATGTLFEMVISANTFLRSTNLLKLVGGKISGNDFVTPPTITWASSGGVLSDNVFNNGAPTVTAAGRVYLNSGYDLGSGAITLAAGTGTATVWAGCRPVCTDTTANASVKCAVAATTLTATGTGTDVINYFCF